MSKFKRTFQQHKSGSLYDTARWRKLRTLIMNRSPVCVRCGHPGEVIDHIEPINQGGDPWDESNLQVLCYACHQAKSGGEDRVNKGYPPFMSQVVLVTGAPGSGKNHYVQSEFIPNADMLVDLDKLSVAITLLPPYERMGHHLPFLIAAKDSLIYELTNSALPGVAWVLSSDATPKTRLAFKRSGAKLITLYRSPSFCMRNIKQDTYRAINSTAAWERLVRAWFNDFQRVEGETLVEY